MGDEQLTSCLAALGHPMRMRLYRLLIQAGPDGIGPVAISKVVGIKRSLVSYHLKPLVSSGLVASRRQGRDVGYRAVVEGMIGLIGALQGLSDLVGPEAQDRPDG